jgi:hypothetical protein
MTPVGGAAEVPQVGDRDQVTQLREAQRESAHQQLLVVELLLYNGRMHLSPVAAVSDRRPVASRLIVLASLPATRTIDSAGILLPPRPA